VAGGPAERPRAILVGGYFGAWLPPEVAWPVPMAHAALRAVGGALGAGIVIVLPESSCGLAETARVVRYLSEETAEQCGPCMFGLPALADAMIDLAFHGGRRRAAEQVATLIPLIEGRGACRHPDGATQLAASALRAFRPDAEWHDRVGPCLDRGPGGAADVSQRRGKLHDQRKTGHRPGARHDLAKRARVGAELGAAGLRVRAADVQLEPVNRCALELLDDAWKLVRLEPDHVDDRARVRQRAAHPWQVTLANLGNPGIRQPHRVDHPAVEFRDPRRRRSCARLE